MVGNEDGVALVAPGLPHQLLGEEVEQESKERDHRESESDHEEDLHILLRVEPGCAVLLHKNLGKHGERVSDH